MTIKGQRQVRGGAVFSAVEDIEEHQCMKEGGDA